MARYYENSIIFNFTWDQVASGYWKRYPNPQSIQIYWDRPIITDRTLLGNKPDIVLMDWTQSRVFLVDITISHDENLMKAETKKKQNTHVLSEDTLSRQVKNGCLHSKRILTKTNRVPKWGERFITSNRVKIIEESIVDPENKVFVTYTRNLGYAKVMSVVERVEYRPSGTNTVAVRSAWIDSQVFGFSRAIRAFGVDRFKKNCTQMVNGFNFVLSNMFPKTPATQTHGLVMTHTLKEMREAAAAATDRAKANVLSSVNRS